MRNDYQALFSSYSAVNLLKCKQCGGEIRQYFHMDIKCSKCGKKRYVKTFCPKCGGDEEFYWRDAKKDYFCPECGYSFRISDYKPYWDKTINPPKGVRK